MGYLNTRTLKQLISVLILAGVASAQSQPEPSTKLPGDIEQLKERLKALIALEDRLALLEQELVDARMPDKALLTDPETPSAPLSAKPGEPSPEPEPIKPLPGRSSAGAPANLDLSRIGKETLVVVVHNQNPLDDISVSQLRDMLLKRVRSWPNRNAVTLVLSEPGSEIFGRVANTVLHLSALEYQATTSRRADRRVNSASPQDLVALVVNDPAALTVVPAELVAGRTGVKLLSVAGKNAGESGYGF